MKVFVNERSITIFAIGNQGSICPSCMLKQTRIVRWIRNTNVSGDKHTARHRETATATYIANNRPEDDRHLAEAPPPSMESMDSIQTFLVLSRKDNIDQRMRWQQQNRLLM